MNWATQSVHFSSVKIFPYRAQKQANKKKKKKKKMNVLFYNAHFPWLLVGILERGKDVAWFCFANENQNNVTNCYNAALNVDWIFVMLNSFRKYVYKFCYEFNCQCMIFVLKTFDFLGLFETFRLSFIEWTKVFLSSLTHSVILSS